MRSDLERSTDRAPSVYGQQSTDPMQSRRSCCQGSDMKSRQGRPRCCVSGGGRDVFIQPETAPVHESRSGNMRIVPGRTQACAQRIAHHQSTRFRPHPSSSIRYQGRRDNPPICRIRDFPSTGSGALLHLRLHVGRAVSADTHNNGLIAHAHY